MKSSQSLKEIIPALIKSQKNIKPVPKKGENPHFKSDYVEYADAIETAKKALNENDIFVSHPSTLNEGGVLIIETILLHISGEWISSELPAINKQGTDQGQGSSISYAKRQSIMALLAMSTADDDGNAASIGKQKEESKPINQPPSVNYFEPLPAFDELPDNPHKDEGDEVITFGIHKTKTFRETVENQGYLKWVAQTMKSTPSDKIQPQFRKFYEYAKAQGKLS